MMCVKCSVDKSLLYHRTGYSNLTGIFSSSPLRPDRLWGPSSLLSSGYRG